MVVTSEFYLSCSNLFQAARAKVGSVGHYRCCCWCLYPSGNSCSQCSNGNGVVLVGATEFIIWWSSWVFRSVVVVVTDVAVEATTLEQPLLVVTTVCSTGTVDATNPVANVVNIVISNDDFKVSSVSKMGIADNVAVTSVLVVVDLTTLVVDMTMLAKDTEVAKVKTHGIWTSLNPTRIFCALSSKETVASMVGNDFRQ